MIEVRSEHVGDPTVSIYISSQAYKSLMDATPSEHLLHKVLCEKVLTGLGASADKTDGVYAMGDDVVEAVKLTVWGGGFYNAVCKHLEDTNTPVLGTSSDKTFTELSGFN